MARLRTSTAGAGRGRKRSAASGALGWLLNTTAGAWGTAKPGQQWHWHKGEHQSGAGVGRWRGAG